MNLRSRPGSRPGSRPATSKPIYKEKEDPKLSEVKEFIKTVKTELKQMKARPQTAKEST